MSAATRLQAAWLVRGPLACLLWPVSWLYRLMFELRRSMYRSGLVGAQRLPVPVIVVGNLIVGGAGKTPTTLALVRLLRARGYTPGVISRGYGRDRDSPLILARDTPVTAAGDEPLLIHLRSSTPVAVGRDRVETGRLLLARHPEINVVLSDDGLQHFRLSRDAQVIVFDERGAGNGWLLPAGPLREPVPTATPPRTVVLYNASRPSTALAGHLAQRSLASLTPLAAWWDGHAGKPDLIDSLRGRDLLAAAGMARPQRYFDMLRSFGLTIRELALPDHYAYATLPWPAHTADVVVTEKDAVKLRPEAVGATRVWVATLDFEPDAGFADALLQWLPAAPTP